MTVEAPRPISPSDVTTAFDSGDAALDRYLAQRALANHISDLSRCYVCCDETGSIVGFYTLSAVSVGRAHAPGALRRNAPDPLPAVLLGRLAVDRAVQGRGLGRGLVRDAILSTLAAADRIGVRVLLVHAKDSAAAAFYERLGFRRSPTDPLHLMLPLADARESLR